ncbi:Mitogen-activated protein kinase 4a [Phlyctochytrium bullatum]|nr:Mitogen-activated protein kinase 4a [Phlyctochytrium bullatum]
MILGKVLTFAAALFGLAAQANAQSVCDASFADGLLRPEQDPNPFRARAVSITEAGVSHRETIPGLPPFISGMSGLGVVEFETLQFAGALLPYSLDIARKAVAAQIQFEATKFNITKLTEPGFARTDAGPDFMFGDDLFGRSRHLFYAGYIQRATRLPFSLTDAAVAGLLPAGETLSKALAAGKLYVEDHSSLGFLEKLHVPGKSFAYPTALFYRSAVTGLKPLAIKLSYNSPLIVTPRDGAIWTLAKIMTNSAYSTRSIQGNHFTEHFAMVPLTTSYHRKLASNHPIRVILTHPLRQNIGIVSFGGRTLLTPQVGFFDNLLAIGAFSYYNLAPDAEIAARGLGNLMDDLPYYNIARRYHQTFLTLMTDLVNVYYPDDAAVVRDRELQAYALDVATLGKVTGFPSSFATRGEVARMLALAFYQATFRHGLLGTLGLEWIQSLPLSTFSFHRALPKTKTEVTDANIITWFPSLTTAISEIQLVARFGRPVLASENLYGAYNPLPSIGVPGVRSNKTACAFDKYLASLTEINQAVSAFALNDPVVKGWDVMSPTRLPNFFYN